MADWFTTEDVYVADGVGRPRLWRVGVVKVNNRVSFGIQLTPDAPLPGNLPDFTADLDGLSDLITVLNNQRRRLIGTPGGIS